VPTLANSAARNAVVIRSDIVVTKLWGICVFFPDISMLAESIRPSRYMKNQQWIPAKIDAMKN
jgi:hypothetical protein